MAAVAKRKAKKPKALRVKKLSSLLAIGLRDLRKQERAKNSVVDMTLWYSRNGQCSACLAGSVLRFSCGFNRPCDLQTLDDLKDKRLPALLVRQMQALNSLREGDVGYAIDNLKDARLYPDDQHPLDRYEDMPAYDGPRGRWWTAMKKLHADLVAAGE